MFLYKTDNTRQVKEEPKMQIQDMDDICRVCLYDGPNLTNIFEMKLVDSEQHIHKGNDFVEDSNITFSDVLSILTPTMVNISS